MPTTTTVLRERLDALGSRKQQARDRAATFRAAMAQARSDHDQQATEIAEQAFAEAQDELQVIQGLELAAMRQHVGGIAPFGQVLRDNLGAQSVLGELAGSSAPIRNQISLGPIMSIDETVELTGSRLRAAPVDVGDSSRSGAFLGLAPKPTPTPTPLLEYFPSRPFDGLRQDYVQRTGGVADAGIQVEGAIKTEASLVYSGESVEAVVIASWSKVDRPKLDDIPGLLADLQLALRTGVLTHVEQLLVGSPAVSGAPPGVLNSSGVLSPTITATNLADAIGQVKVALLTTGVAANFAAAHPATIEEEAARTGTDGQYVNTIAPDGSIRQIPVVPSIALAEDQLLMGDSTLGGYLGVRQPVSAAIGQESDDFVRNRVTVLVEGRWAPVILVPGAFAVATVA